MPTVNGMPPRKVLRLLRQKLFRFRTEARIYRRILGTWGVFAVSSNLVCQCPRETVFNLEELQHPLFLRLGTSDAEVYQSVFVDMEYDYPVSFSPQTIIDAGANCGMTSVFYANRYPDARIVAIEPEDSNYQALVKNTRAYPNITPIHAALWNVDGQVEIFSGWPRMQKWGKWGFRVRSGNGCRALTLPTLMREVGIESVDILKIDVEGAEGEIFSDCVWMDKVKLLAIELHEHYWPGSSEPVKAVTKNHQKVERGSVTFYARQVDIAAGLPT